ncbi:hypothetical protein N9Y09_01275 [Candidatus Actinomarina sp.]|nr:hypothetical protein [Acidimicrobiia bacterium]MDA7850382.1 hypothetical protein [Acidimicrobiaceae bacterium]MDA8652619.1 hypothetical protein [Candidatus Actinomarina sp.]MDA8710368.1 hypothetical protein [Candidatus Actinomarina sp.]MDA8812915.1 hypothetical protein [Candidatus Actinomarina sp.]
MNNFNQDVVSIKLKRNNFLINFSMMNDDLFENLRTSRSDNELNSIRVHKYLTHTKVVGKVETARFLDTIGLDEKTTIGQITDKNISQILDFFKIK